MLSSTMRLVLICSLLSMSVFYVSAWSYKWPTTTIPYIVNATQYTKSQLAVFYQGLADLQNKTCIRFVERTTEVDYIYIYYSGINECNGQQGYYGGQQNIKLTPACMAIRKKPIHEIIHGLGFHHHHQRFDRDDYITINWDNIAPEDQQWFAKLNNPQEAYNTTFDYLSCMNYGRDFFSANGNDTITTKDPAYQNSIGYELTLSDGDATRINRMYNCPAPYV